LTRLTQLLQFDFKLCVAPGKVRDLHGIVYSLNAFRSPRLDCAHFIAQQGVMEFGQTLNDRLEVGSNYILRGVT
jgi:hypothetical protein